MVSLPRPLLLSLSLPCHSLTRSPCLGHSFDVTSNNISLPDSLIRALKEPLLLVNDYIKGSDFLMAQLCLNIIESEVGLWISVKENNDLVTDTKFLIVDISYWGRACKTTVINWERKKICIELPFLPHLPFSTSSFKIHGLTLWFHDRLPFLTSNGGTGTRTVSPQLVTSKAWRSTPLSHRAPFMSHIGASEVNQPKEDDNVLVFNGSIWNERSKETRSKPNDPNLLCLTLREIKTKLQHETIVTHTPTHSHAPRNTMPRHAHFLRHNVVSRHVVSLSDVACWGESLAKVAGSSQFKDEGC